MKIIIGNTTFNSKAEAAKKCRQLQDLHFRKGNIEGEDRLFLEELFKRHPRKESKLGGGITAIWCDLAPEIPSKCFYVRRVDGTTIDIAWTRCLNKPDRRADVLRIMRRAVMEQIVAFKTKTFSNLETTPSAISSLPLKWNEVHVDHHNPSFLVLAEKWRNGQPWDNFQLDLTENLGKFANELDRKSWCDYHEKNANLRIISIKENLSKSDKEDNEIF